MFDFAEKRPSEIPIVVLDTETTGLSAALGHRVVEIALVRLEQWRVTAEMTQLLNPGRLMDARASQVNGLTDADLVGQPRFAQVAPEVLALLDGALLVAHNAAFDASFLAMEFFISGYSQEGQPILANPWLCTLTLARNCFYFGQNKLGHIAHRLGVRMGQAHRALGDVYMTVEVLKRMVQELQKQRLVTVGDLLHAQGGPIYAPSPPQVYLPPPIAEALQYGRDLHILYISPGSGESDRRITPMYPTVQDGTPYLVAYCHVRQEQRTFRLDRIFSARVV